MSGISVDVAIVGAGPAGMAAALKLRELGIAAAVFDEQPSPGATADSGEVSCRSCRDKIGPYERTTGRGRSCIGP